MAEKRFEARIALVTGASQPRGIGAACARKLAAEGAAVAVAARGAAGLDVLCKEIEQAGGRALAVPTDVTDLDACRALLDGVVEAFGGLDLLVNNAGLNVRGDVLDQDPAQLVEIIRVNLIAPIVLTRLALPHLRGRGGRIVQVASIAGQFPLDGEATYSASKWGLRGFSFALREELRDSDVEVSVVSPGPVETGFILDDLDAVPDLVFSQPMSSPEEIADAVLACAADGQRERTIPQLTGWLARLSSAVPNARRALMPVLERQGRAAKERFRAKHRG